MSVSPLSRNIRNCAINNYTSISISVSTQNPSIHSSIYQRVLSLSLALSLSLSPSLKRERERERGYNDCLTEKGCCEDPNDYMHLGSFSLRTLRRGQRQVRFYTKEGEALAHWLSLCRVSFLTSQLLMHTHLFLKPMKVPRMPPVRVFWL